MSMACLNQKECKGEGIMEEQKQIYKVCPNCKGTTGFQFNVLVGYWQQVDLFANPIDADHNMKGDKEGEIFTCMDCGKNFRRNTLLID